MNGNGNSVVREPGGNAAEDDPLSLKTTGPISATGDSNTPAQSKVGSVNQNHAVSHSPSLGGKQEALSIQINASSMDYLQSPRLLGHGELFLDRVFTEEDWDAHISFRRYLPEPVVMYAPSRTRLHLNYALLLSYPCYVLPQCRFLE